MAGNDFILQHSNLVQKYRRFLLNRVSSSMNHPKDNFMNKAIRTAISASKSGQYPIGSVVVCGNKIIAVGYTTIHQKNDPTAHAEINTIRKACRKLHTRYLQKCWLYTTQEPCSMCTSAAIWAQMEGIVYGASIADAAKIFSISKKSKFTWRQIHISAAQIILKGTPKLKLHKNFLRDKCLRLYTPDIEDQKRLS